MLHAPTSETKQQSDPSRTQVAPESERLLHPRFATSVGWFGAFGAGGALSLASPSVQRRKHIAGWQATYGNQAVLRMLNREGHAHSTAPAGNVAGVLQRKCACGGTGSKCAACKEEASLQRAAAGPGSVNEVPPIVHDVLRSSGQPLDESTRAFFEPRFDHDFSHVRVHTDAKAADSARAVNALAYTIGRDVVFGPGQYGPSSSAGRRLLAHELAHVVQQDLGHPEPRTSTEAHSEVTVEQTGSDTLSPRSSEHLGSTRVPRPGLTPTAKRMSTLFRAITEACVAPIEVPTVTPVIASGFGDFAELVIEADYCTLMGCRPFPLGLTDHFDNRITGASSYIAFIAVNNPSLSAVDIATLAVLSQIELNRPDILTHRVDRQEFYEIKPNSITGRLAGKLKVGNLIGFYGIWSLPYVPGAVYTPTPEIVLASGHVGPWPLEVFLRVSRLIPGLIVYDICARGELAKIGLLILLAILAIIIIIMSRGAVKPPIPIPVPEPVPIPALAVSSGAPSGFGEAAVPLMEGSSPTPTSQESGPTGTPLQAKLIVSQPSDISEREADRFASFLMQA